MKNAQSRIAAAVLALTAVVTAALLSSEPLLGQDENGPPAIEEPASSEATIANCRYGTTPITGNQVPIVSEIGSGWYLNFTPFPPTSNGPANGAEFVHMIGVRQDKVLRETDPSKQCSCPDDYRYLDTFSTNPKLNQSFANYIQANKGRKYIVGNETDRFGQGETFASVYADAYHEIYNFVKSHDPSAQVAITGLVQFTPNREQYLDQVWSAYIRKYGTYMPVDIWTMHLYVLPELMADGVTPNGIASIAMGTDKSLGRREAGGNASFCSETDVYCFAEHDDLSVFAEQVVSMRQWMKKHGQQNKPLLITEYSILYPYDDDGATCFIQDEFGNCFTPQRVTNFLDRTFDYLNTNKDPNLGYPQDGNRLVQQWMWYAIRTDFEGRASNLVQADLKTLTMVGNRFKSRVANAPLSQNLAIEKVRNSTVALDGSSTTSAELAVQFRNNGSQAITEPFVVTFYKNPNLTVPIGSVTIEPPVYGCASHAYTASVTWNGLARGRHAYYVLVDSSGAIAESPAGNADNLGQGTVIVNSNQVNLPVVRSDR